MALPHLWPDLWSQKALGRQYLPSLYTTRAIFLCFCHCFAFEFHPPLEVNVTAAEWMRSFHLFALYSSRGTFVPLRAEKLKCSVCPGFLLYFYRFQTPGWQPLLTWRYTVERVSCFGRVYEDWEMSTDRCKLLADSVLP